MVRLQINQVFLHPKPTPEPRLDRDLRLHDPEKRRALHVNFHGAIGPLADPRDGAAPILVVNHEAGQVFDAALAKLSDRVD